ncbi:MAG: glycosyltransferase [Chloroflexi bacterium]|nr:glycosyltransferase [Chloroflexota bacterium]
MPKRIVFLMSDTGGGHRAAAEAIRDAILERQGPDSIRAELVDVYKRMSFPANKMPEFYPWIVNNSSFAWSVAYKLGDSPKRARLASRFTYQFNRANLRAIVREYPADAVCCVHSVVGQPAFSAYNSFPTRPPWVTVVTDLVTTPYFWYDRRVDLCLVPTEEARQRGLQCGLKPQKIRVTGLPVHPNFTRRLTDKPTARAALGLPNGRTIVMLVAGGDGMGPLLETVVALLDKRLPNVHYVVVCGRNKALKEKIDAAVEQWGATNVSTYGFVTNMPQFMAASDILVTKAGPSTITEAAIAGLPLILSGAIPGQEDGNVRLVVDNDAGAFAPGPAKVAEMVEAWIAGGSAALAKRAESVRRIAHPDAVWEIADEVWAAANRPRVPSVARARP